MITYFLQDQKVWVCSPFAPYLLTGELYSRVNSEVVRLLTDSGKYMYANMQNVFYDKTEACVHAADLAAKRIKSYYSELGFCVGYLKSGKLVENHLKNTRYLLRIIQEDKTNWGTLKEQYGELLPTFEELRE